MEIAIAVVPTSGGRTWRGSPYSGMFHLML
jgi:hypothetical protein